MKTQKILIVASLALLVFFVAHSQVFARDGAGDTGDRQQVSSEDQKSNDNVDVKELDQQDNSSSTDSELNNENDQNSNENENESDSHERMMGNIISDLNKIGKENRGIGDEISDIAKDEASSTDMRVRVMQAIEQRDAISKFFFGIDKNSLKTLSQELDNTQKNIDRLQTVKDSVASSTLQTQLDEQIKSLQDAQAKAVAFVKANENSFSLFGWFVSLFK